MSDINGLRTNLAGRDNRYSRVKIFLSTILLFVAFAITHLIKRGNLHIEGIYLEFLPLYFCCWLLSSLLTGKFKVRPAGDDKYMSRLEPYFSSALFFVGLLSLFIFGLNLYELSRFIVFGSPGIYLLLEILFLSGNFLPLFRVRDMGKPGERRFSVVFFLLEFILLTLTFLVIHFCKIGTIRLQDDYQEVLLLIYFLWLFTGLLVHRFVIPEEKNYFRTIYPSLKSTFIGLSIASFFVFGFRTGFSRLLVFGTLGLYAVFEIFIISIFYLRRRQKKIDVPEINLFEVPETPISRMIEGAVQKERLEAKQVRIEKAGYASPVVGEKLEKVYLRNFPEWFSFIKNAVALESVDILRAEVMDTANIYNVEVLPDNSLELFLNLQPLNNLRRINTYLVEVNRKLGLGGILLGRFEPCEKRYIYFLKNYPPVLANFLYFFDFTWKRVFPKLPILRRIYFGITGGQSRVFSLAEALGRLYFCGFEVVSLESFDNYVYFVVQKMKAPVSDVAPSYGILFKQRRIGQGGKFMHIYKMRTMHPFSEYIHQYIYEKNKLDDKGKISDDFRITGWGRFLRALWIDEIPMLFNLVKGDLKWVGVRPLSETFFNTYPQDLQQERIRFQPGLIPPYYADMPRSIEEVWESERVYLENYRVHPWRTDFFYFFKALNNILFHRAKSA